MDTKTFALQLQVLTRGFRLRMTSNAMRYITSLMLIMFPVGLFAQSNWTVIGWNNLGMHCMDSDYSVFSILPPYNTIHAHVIDSGGNLITNPVGIGVSYHAISDLNGSINRTSKGKGNFWDYENMLFGLSLPDDTGLPVPGPDSFKMPGTNNVRQAMLFEPGFNWFAAYGVPISPYDDNGKPNQYPMMRLMVTNTSGHVLAMTDIVLPVSDEMDCKLCHASGSGPAAEPDLGWVWDAHPGRDYRLNILRMHDQFGLTNPVYVAALSTKGFNSEGLYATAAGDGQPVLCAACHLSEALPGSGVAGIPPLTEAMHSGHEVAIDPRNGMSLGSDVNRQSCYTCHPGSETRCLRGAMGRAVASDGSMLMQCQSCHGSMAEVGSPLRTGWLDEPNCQACHVGSATNSFGVIRFTDALTNGSLRIPTEAMFATNPDTPPGHSLYRFSAGHGGLQCSACHGSTHAIYPTSLPSDNMASIQQQGHAGTLSECTSCHQSMPSTRNGGPHGMHRTGQSWINDHNDAAQQLGKNSCRTCHGQTGQGSVLSLMFSAKTITSERGTINYWKGQKVTCYGCHDGMNTGDPTTKGVPVVTNVFAFTTSGVPVAITLNGPSLRIVDQPQYGLAALAGLTATYFPPQDFVGTDTFTFAANNGFNDSNLGVVEVVVDPSPAGPPAPDASYIFNLNIHSNSELGLATRLGDVYHLESSSNLVDETWQALPGDIWGHTDATWVTDPLVFDYMRHFRVVTIDDPPAPIPSSDDGGQPEYNSGWVDLSNGGEGFGDWALSLTGGASGGFFITATNAVYLDMDSRAWGLWANNGTTTSAKRVFSSPLNSGDAVAFIFENNFVDNGRRVGVDFRNASGSVLATFLFIGGQSTYRIEDHAGSRVTRIPWSNKEWNMTMRVSDKGEYVLTCGTYHVPGLLKSAADQKIAEVRFWNGSAGNGSDHDVYVNNLRVLNP